MLTTSSYRSLSDRRADREEMMHRIAAERGGKCLTEYHPHHKDRVKFQCECGYIWETSPYVIEKSWCPACAKVAPLTMSRIREIVEKRGGKIVEGPKEIRRNTQNPIIVACSKGHSWETKVKYLAAGNWCPMCSNRLKGTIEGLQTLAKSRGGKCISPEYLGGLVKHQWECSEGHRWWATPGQVKGSVNRKGSWCRECWRKSLKGKKRPLK